MIDQQKIPTMDNYQKEKTGKRGNLVKTWVGGLPNPTSMFLLFLLFLLLQNDQKNW